MRKFLLQIIMTVLIYVDSLDPTEFKYWFEIPEDESERVNILLEKVRLPVAKITSAVWESMFCAMSDKCEPTDNELLKIFLKPADSIRSATVEIHIETVKHLCDYQKGLLPENSNFRGWSPTLHNIIEGETNALENDICNMILAISKAYFDGSDEGGDPRYGIHRNSYSSQADA